VPGAVVDAVVVNPGQHQAALTAYEPAPSGETRLPLSEIPLLPFGPEVVIARRVAQELRAGDVAALGFGVSASCPGCCWQRASWTE
jgi:propionate CoA-transferase